MAAPELFTELEAAPVVIRRFELVTFAEAPDAFALFNAFREAVWAAAFRPVMMIEFVFAETAAELTTLAVNTKLMYPLAAIFAIA